MKSRRVKRWLVLFREGYLWSHRPACLPPSRHRSTDSACGVSQHRVSRHPSFFNPPPSLSFGFAGGLDGRFLYFIKVKLNNILILFDRCGGKKPCSNIWVNVLWWSWHSLFLFSFYVPHRGCASTATAKE